MGESELSGDYLDKLGLPLEAVAQGAEARVWRVAGAALAGCGVAGVPAGASVVLKERFPKTYRHPALDATLTRRRTRAEARVMERLRAAAVRVPAVYWPTPSVARRRGANTTPSAHDNAAPSETASESATPATKTAAPAPTRLPACVLAMEDVGTESTKAFLRAHRRTDGTYGAEAYAVCRRLGAAIAAMHAAGVVHGDLTTSNAMLVPSDDADSVPQVALIDFGLSTVSSSVEDRAVDLYVLERAFLCTHEQSEPLVNTVLAAYATAAAELAHTHSPVSKKPRQAAAPAAVSAVTATIATTEKESAPEDLSTAPKNAVLDRLCQVRQRGRKKLAFG